MGYCKRCIMPDTKPDLYFDEEGVCIACKASDYKHDKIDWKARKKEFENLLDRYRSRDPSKYDCIVPTSGGKDSTYQAFVMKHVFNMNPLCVHFEPTYPSEIGRQNLENMRNLGLDVLSFKPNPHIYTKICREAFTKVGDHEWPNHVGIFTVPVRVAVQYNIPLLLWGENSQLEYGGPMDAAKKEALNRRWLEEFGGLLGLRVNDLNHVGISEADLKPYVYPSEDELKKVGISGVFLGYYFKWDARRQVELVKKVGFNVRTGPVEGTYVNYENLDDEIVSIHDYFKYIKFGFGRASDHTSLDIRNSRLSRADALKLLAKYDGKLFSDRVAMFCKRFAMSKQEFFTVVEKYANKSIFKVDDNGKLIWENGQLVNLMLQKELERNHIVSSQFKDTSPILTQIDNIVKNQITKEGYVTGLIDAKNFDTKFGNWQHQFS
ncbi:Uncharacterised protein [Candidatus Bilamarchaeum dharawalense]|uniref:N-acetyl sugar amidotransferase n=1 Tax=Candidatus Bilamarchaeum dharawalense TaxID=2885759 RepID=A0A5E4LSD9_9ARCH|nr:Uncharacterised protein [Candidatus Bilamarchaeum dharawalense]